MQSASHAPKLTERRRECVNSEHPSPPPKRPRMSKPPPNSSSSTPCLPAQSLPSKRLSPFDHSEPSDTRPRISPAAPSSSLLPASQTVLEPGASSLADQSFYDRLSVDSKWFRKPTVVWYRGHDLRVDDHPALLAAAQRGGPVVPLFVWDSNEEYAVSFGNAKKWWLRKSLMSLDRSLRRLGVKLYTRTGNRSEQVRSFLKASEADAVFWNRSYEPGMVDHDENLRMTLNGEGYTAESFKAELLVEPWELSASEVAPRFKTFDAYLRAWMRLPPPPEPFPSPSRLKAISKEVRSIGIEGLNLYSSSDVEQTLSKTWSPGSDQAEKQLQRFLREVFPAFGESRTRHQLRCTSRLSPHIRFGEISPRRMYHATRRHVSAWNRDLKYVSKSMRDSKKTVFNGLKDPAFPVDGPRSGSGRPSSTDKLNDQEKSMHISKKNPAISQGISQRQERIQNSRGVPTRVQGIAAASSHNVGKPSKVQIPCISISARVFLKNLCLRDFASHVLHYYPEFNTKPLVPEFTNYPWAKDEGTFERWCEGKTGYPIIDAAMRQLRSTGWIHNGLRFLLASFLTKHLLLPWVKGLKVFYGLLVDGDHSSNALGWQWTAGSNTDSFPLKLLVNPARIGYRHDPKGNYVQRWVPELANLPRKYVHEPWKAPANVLRDAGVQLGFNYPQRVIMMQEAKTRVQKTIMVMKQVFALSNVSRSIPDLTDTEIKEVPEEQPELLHLDDPTATTPKLNLLPSLWSLVRYETSNPYLSDPPPSPEPPIIALDTASLDDGALAVPLDEGESIEHALLSAHEPTDSHRAFPSGSEERLAASLQDGDLLNLGYPSAADLRQSYGAHDDDRPLEPDKLDGDVDLNMLEDIDRDDREGFIGNHRETAYHQSKSHMESNDRRSMGIMPSLNSSPQQMRNLSESLEMDPSSKDFNVDMHSSAEIPVSSMPVEVPRDAVMIDGTSSIPKAPFSTPMVASTPLSDYHNGPGRAFSAHVPGGGAHASMDAMFVGAGCAGGNPNSVSRSIAPMANAVMMGGFSSGSDIPPAGHGFGGDPNAALYAQHMGISPFYGFSPMMPMVSPPSGPEHSGVLGGGAGSKFAPMSGVMPVGYSVYGGGMLDTGLLNGAFGANGSPYTTFVPGSTQPMAPHVGGTSVPTGVVAPTPAQSSTPAQSPTSTIPNLQHMSRRVQSSLHHSSPVGYGISHGHSPYMHGPGRNHDGGIAVPNNVGSASSLGMATQASMHGVPMVAPNNMPNGVEDRPMWATEDRQRTKPVQDTEADSQLDDKYASRMNGGVEDYVEENRDEVLSPVAEGVSVESPHRHNLGVVNASRIRSFRNSSRANVSTDGVRTKGSRGRKNLHQGLHTGDKERKNHDNGNGNGSGGKKNRFREGRSTVSSRVKAKNGGDRLTTSSTLDDKEGNADLGEAPTSLKGREERLAIILSKPEHEYYEFAKYIDDNYELTDNTDRHSSKDYVRLCNLKDDYHKHCEFDQTKLKIYRIKSFFSKILRLEVTGEWDRHNHGGVRGPYVYGIRLRRKGEKMSNDSTGVGDSSARSSAG